MKIYGYKNVGKLHKRVVVADIDLQRLGGMIVWPALILFNFLMFALIAVALYEAELGVGDALFFGFMFLLGFIANIIVLVDKTLKL